MSFAGERKKGKAAVTIVVPRVPWPPKTPLVRAASNVERAIVARADINAIWFGLAAALSIGMLSFDLTYERLFDRQPCPWCDLEQASLLLAGFCAVLGVLVRRSPFSAGVLAGFVLLLAACGFAAACAQLDAEKSASCDLATANKIIGALRLDRVLPDLFQVRAKCDAAKGLDPRFWKWSAGVFTGLCALMLLVLRNLRIPVSVKTRAGGRAALD